LPVYAMRAGGESRGTRADLGVRPTKAGGGIGTPGVGTSADAARMSACATEMVGRRWGERD
jgi:hypothetical protein